MFAVQGMRRAPAAVLLEGQPLPGVRLVLDRHIVATLALVAGHRDGRSLIRRHLALSLHSVTFYVLRISYFDPS